MEIDIASTGSRTPDPTAEAGTLAREDPTARWIRICLLEDIVPNTGVCALIGQRQVAVVRVGAGSEIYAISNFDPFSKAFVLSRGIVGDRQGVPKIASPIYKQSFDLRTGICLDDPAVTLPTFPVRVEGGVVELLAPAPSATGA